MLREKCLEIAILLLVSTILAITEETSGPKETFAIELTQENFDKALARNNHFIKFYAPWCGHCKRLHPLWEELAELMNVKDDPQVVIAKVDCTEHQDLCAEHDITGYPTLRFFKVGEKGSSKFTGTRDMPAITDFINQQLNADAENAIVSNEKISDEMQEPRKGELLELTEENFAKKVSSGNHFIKFYAPWCSHCQRLAPTWQQLASTLANEGSVTIGKIDCTVYRPICQDFEVKGYPTLLWIEDGKKIEKYSGSRDHDALRAYVEKMLGIESTTKAAVTEKTSKDNIALDVVQLTGENFDKAIAKGITFVKFYAPWCGHCQKLNPIWDTLAEKVHSSKKDVMIAKVDCTAAENKQLCNDQHVEGYPTLFAYKDGERQSEYYDSRSLTELMKYISKLRGHDEL